MIRQVPLRAVPDLVLVIAGGRHPRPVRGGTGVVVEERCPRRYRGFADIGVAQVAVEQVEQRVEVLHRRHDVAGVRRPRTEALTDRGRDRLVAEAREPETAGPAPGPGAEHSAHRPGALVEDLVALLRV